MNEMRDYLKKQADHQVLKYAVGRQISCPVASCGRILDYRKAVVLTLNVGKDVRTICMCKACYDSEAVQKQLRVYEDHITETLTYQK